MIEMRIDGAYVVSLTPAGRALVASAAPVIDPDEPLKPYQPGSSADDPEQWRTDKEITAVLLVRAEKAEDGVAVLREAIQKAIAITTNHKLGAMLEKALADTTAGAAILERLQKAETAAEASEQQFVALAKVLGVPYELNTAQDLVAVVKARLEAAGELATSPELPLLPEGVRVEFDQSEIRYYSAAITAVPILTVLWHDNRVSVNYAMAIATLQAILAHAAARVKGKG